MLEKLQLGEIDLGILALPVRHGRARVARAVSPSLSRWRCPSIIAWPSARRVRVEDLQGETLLLLEDGHCLRDQALEVCSRIGPSEKQDFRATSLETLRQMVATGAGITLLPELGDARRVWPCARRGDPALRAARAGATRRRRVAQVERAACPPLRRSARPSRNTRSEILG